MIHNRSVKLTARVKLVTSAEDHALLLRTLETANAACNWISSQAWAHQEFRQPGLQKIVYRQVREDFGLSSQIAVRAIGKVSESYRLDRKVQRTFSQHGAFPYDERNLSWKMPERTVSISTLAGRLHIPFQCGPRQEELLKSRKGEAELIYFRSDFYLSACCDVDEPDPPDVDDFLGVDFGVANIATDSDGHRHSGSHVKSVRHRHRRLRQRLQKKGTRSAKRRLKALSGKERRFAAWVNHNISKQIVAQAKGTGRGISVEDLSGIRDRVTVRRKQRVVLHSWAFHQLRSFLEYKSRLHGVPFVVVAPRNSSRQCSACGHAEKANRQSQDKFYCRACGHTDHADHNAAMNLRERGRAACKPAERDVAVVCLSHLLQAA